MIDQNLSAQIEFKHPYHPGSCVLVADFLASVDTVQPAVTLPVELVQHLDRLCGTAVLAGTLPDGMTVRDVLLTLGMRSVINQVAAVLERRDEVPDDAGE